MTRSLSLPLGVAVFGVAFALSSAARASGVPLGDCSYETSCSAECTAGSINCNIQFVDSCSGGCTATATDSCTTACATQCMTNPGSFSCSGYCGDQCETLCSSNNNYGAESQTDCITDCQGQCSYSCNESPASTTCSTECGTSCQATENIQCSIECQVKDSGSCSITPATCSASCGSGGGVIVCNGQVVYVAATLTDAADWYIAHLDAQFSLMVSTTCTGDSCTTTATETCSATPRGAATDPAGPLLAGLAFAGVGVARRRRRRP